MIVNLLSKLFGIKQKGHTRKNGADFEITKKRLQGDRRRSESLNTSDVETRWSAGLLKQNKVFGSSTVSRQSAAYWRQGFYDAQTPRTMQQQLSIIYAPAVGPLNALKTDSALEDFNTKLTYGAKQRALNSYFMRSQEAIAASQSNEIVKLEPIIIESEPLMGAQEILFNLARNQDVNVRASIAENEQTPTEAMWILVEDESSMVRSKLAANLRCPVAILEILCNDNDFIVSHKATKALRRLWQGADASIVSGKLSEDVELGSENYDGHLVQDAS